MLINLNKKIAFICPFCSEINSEELSLFKLSGGRTGFDCMHRGCGEECVCIEHKKDKYRIQVECPICADLHTFTISADAFLNKPVTIFKCPVSDIDIFYAGEGEAVDKALNSGLEQYSDMIMPFFPDDIDILSQMLEVIERLSGSGDVSCSCGNEHISFKPISNYIVFACSKCGRKKTIEICEDSLAALLNASAIILK
ncbi:MAG: hypothetical protein PUF72_10565 [Clostridiales bacterium]|nr:hypothetical protein [Clostridiales bacterium]